MGDFQTASAALSVVVLATSVIKQLIEAKDDAQKLIERVETNKTLNENFAILSEARRQQRGQRPQSDAEEHFSKLFLQSIEGCHTSLKQLQGKLRHDSNLPEHGMRRSAVDAVRLLVANNSIQKLESQVEKRSKNVALSLNALHYIDSTTDSATTHELLHTIIGLLKKNLDITPDDPDDAGLPWPAPTLAEEEEDERIKELKQLLLPKIPKTPQEEAVLVAAGDTPIMVAVNNDDIEDVAKFLRLDKNSAYQADDYGWTVLHYAVQKKNAKMLEVLLGGGITDKRGFIDAKSKQNQTPLMLAAKAAGTQTAYEIAKALIVAGCKLDPVDGEGRDALCHAMENTPDNTSERFVKLLVDSGAEVLIVASINRKAVSKYQYVDEKVSQQDNGSEPYIKRLSGIFSTSSRDE